MDKEEQIKWSLEAARELMKGEGYDAVIAGLQLASEEIESLRAELKAYKDTIPNWKRYAKKVRKERDDFQSKWLRSEESRQVAVRTNVALLEGLREVINEMQPIVESRYSFVGAAVQAVQDGAIELLAQYDTAQPTNRKGDSPDGEAL